MTELVPSTPHGEVVGVHDDLLRFEQMLLDQLAAAGLPTADVLVPVDERETALRTIDMALSSLPVTERGRSAYISKMIAAASAGLFDAALNYLWNETVGELRRRIVGYDLAYFYDVAVPSPDRRKHLSSEEDLTKVDDFDLLKGALQIGLLSATGHARLDHIRYMRNFASAAHPNQVELTGLDLANWLQVCVKQVILLPYDTITAETKRLLANVRAQPITDEDAAKAAAFFDKMPTERADLLATGLVGLYVDQSQAPLVADNVRRLWPLLWTFVSEEARSGFGIKIGRFTASLDTAKAAAGRELLALVGGTAYLPESERAVEIDAAIDALTAAHRGWSNFHTEPAPAKALSDLIGPRGDVPSALENKYIAAVVEAFLGNQYGVSWAAVEHYEAMLRRLDSRQAGKALRTFTLPTISAQLWSSVGQTRWAALLDILAPKLTAPADRALMDAVRAFTSTPDKLASDAKIKKLVAAARG
ncbi:hypothetical protein M3A94_011895 [Micrococcus luteus]|nr:hypothetical protein [Micrococcus luteus]